MKKKSKSKTQPRQLSDLIPQDTLNYYLECYRGMKQIDNYIPEFPFDEINKIGDALLTLQKRKWLDPEDSDTALKFLLDKILDDERYSEEDPGLIDSPYSRYLLYTALRRKSHRGNTTEGRPRDIALDFLIFAIGFDLRELYKKPYWDIVTEFIRREENEIVTTDQIKKRYRKLTVNEIAKSFTCCYGLISDLRKRLSKLKDVESPFFKAKYSLLTEDVFISLVVPGFVGTVEKKIIAK